MKLGVALLVFHAVVAFAPGSYAEKAIITLDINNRPVVEVLDAIEKQSEFRFYYNSKLVDTRRIVSVNVTDMDIIAVLNRLFDSSDIDYKVVDKDIVLTEREIQVPPQTPQPSSVATPQQRQVTGTVVIERDGSPAVGVMVMEQGTQNVTITSDDGRFSMNTEGPDAILSFSFVGLVSQDVPVAGRTDITVRMAEDVVSIEELVVIGFGTRRKADLTGAIASVGAEVFENRPVTSVGQALQGVVPNLNISIGSGQPNAIPEFNIRGGTGMEQNTSKRNSPFEVYRSAPLILVDGVEYSPEMLNQLNPNDIANMSVLKDNSSAAIYGTKAVNGVILVQTKSGRFNQEGEITYSFDFSLASPVATPDILDAASIQQAAMNRTEWRGGVVSDAQRLRMEMIQKYMANPTPENAWYQNGQTIDWVANINPYELALKNSSTTQKHNVSIRGGSEMVSYYISLGYQNVGGLFKVGDENFDRYNALVRVNAKVRPWFNVEARASFSKSDYRAPYLVSGKGALWTAMRNETNRNINMPVRTGPNDPIPDTWTDNVLSWVSSGANYKESKATTTLGIMPEFIITPWLKVKGEFSYVPQTTVYNRTVFKHAYVSGDWNSTKSEQAEAAENRGTLRRASREAYTINTYADFNKSFGVHNLSGVLGFSQESDTDGELEANLRALFLAEVQKPSASDDATLHTINNTLTRLTSRGVFGRVAYNFDNRYMFDINGRYDGSSRFPANKRFVFFPTFSAGWVLSNESFMEPAHSWLDFLKIRGSWGKLGSQPRTRYPGIAIMGSGAASHFIGGKYVSYVGMPSLVSPSLTWQKNTTLNIGLEAILLGDRLNAEFDWYQRTITDNLLMGEKPYPSVLGINPPLVNAGTLRARGFELTLKWRDRLANGFSYSVGATFSDERTQVVEYTGNATRLFSDGQLYTGMWAGEIWGYETGGILQKEDMVETSPGRYTFSGPVKSGTTYYPGDMWLRDRDGNGLITTGTYTIDNPGDLKVIGNITPRYRISLTADFAYKGFDLNLFFQGTLKRDLWIGANGIDASWYWGNGAGSRRMYDNSWRPDRTDAFYPMYGATPDVQSRYLINGAYFRMKQAVLGYSLPSDITDRAGIGRVRISVSAFNLFTISEIPKVFDPDQLTDAYPQTRTISFGAQVTF